MAIIQVGVANSSSYEFGGQLPASLGLIGYAFVPNATGGVYTVSTSAPRVGITTFTFEYITNGEGLIVSISYKVVGLGVSSGFAASGLNIPLALLQSNLADVMPLISSGNDIVTGNGAYQEIHAGSGNDQVFGDAGDDLLYGGDGLDLLIGGAGNDSVYGGIGDDVLKGWEGADSLDGGAGTDTAVYDNTNVGVNVSLLTGIGTGGDAEGDRLTSIENLIGGSGNDVLTGSNSDNRIEGLFGDDTIYGMAGNDVLYGGAGGGHVYGGEGNDYLAGDGFNDLKLYGDAGDDFLDGFGGPALLDGGDGWDMAVYNSGSAGVNVNLSTGVGSGGSAQGDSYASIEAISSSAYSDVLTGTNGTNYFWAGSGDDQLFGMGGFDNLDGAAGNDSIFGGEGDDLLNGGDGSDTIHADAGKDTVFGGNGNDYVIGTGGSLTADGGAGNDQLYGGMSADQLSGGIGDDFLWGSYGNDTLYGGAGVDVVAGALGADVMYGGAGTDYFAMNYDIAYNAYDSIVDFTDGVDWLQLPEYARGLATVTNASFGCVVSIALADSSYNLYVAGVNAAQIADQIYYYGT